MLPASRSKLVQFLCAFANGYFLPGHRLVSLVVYNSAGCQGRQVSADIGLNCVV